MAKICNSGQERVKAFGPERAKKVGLRLDQMRAAMSLQVFKTVHPRCHSLTGDRNGQWSADLDGPYRLIFEIADDPIPLDEHGNINLAQVRKVRIIDVADTHAT
jgi:proteic killer suppression protein